MYFDAFVVTVKFLWSLYDAADAGEETRMRQCGTARYERLLEEAPLNHRDLAGGSVGSCGACCGGLRIFVSWNNLC